MFHIKEKGIFKVVDGAQLETVTTCGWRLVAVLDVDELVSHSDSESVVCPTAQTQYQSFPQTTTLIHQRHHVVKVPRYLVVREENVVISNLQAEVRTLNEKLAGVGELEKKLATLQSEGELTTAKVVRLTTANAELTRLAADEMKVLADYKGEVAEKMKQAEAIILRENERRRTSYERVVQGEYNDATESVEAGSDG